MPPTDPFHYKVEVEGIKDLSNAVTKAEAYYDRMANNLNRVSILMEKSGDAFVQSGSKVEKSTKEVAATEGKTEQASKKSFVSRTKNFLATNKYLKILKSSYLSILGVATSISGFLIVAVKKYLSFDNLFRKLNTVFYDSQSAISGAASASRSLAASYGMAYEEGMQIAKLGGELTAFGGITKNLGKVTRDWVIQVGTLSKATDTSTNAIADMFYTMTQLYGLPHSRLKNIGASFAYIQQKTAISGEELASYVKSLDKLFIRLPSMSKRNKEALTVDMMAIGGAVKSAFGDPQEISSMFSEMAHFGSVQGRKALFEIGRLTGKGGEKIREMVLSGNMAGVIKDLGTAFNNMSLQEIQKNSERLSGSIGISYKTIIAMRTVMKDGAAAFDKQLNTNRKINKEGKYQQDIAKSLHNWWSKFTMQIDEALAGVIRKVGKLALELSEKLLKWVMPKLIKAVKWLGKWFASPEFTKGLARWNYWVEDKLIPAFKTLWNDWLKPISLWLIDLFEGKKEAPLWLQATKEIAAATWVQFKAVMTVVGQTLKGLESIAQFYKNDLGPTWSKILKGILNPTDTVLEGITKAMTELEKFMKDKLGPTAKWVSGILAPLFTVIKFAGTKFKGAIKSKDMKDLVNQLSAINPLMPVTGVVDATANSKVVPGNTSINAVSGAPGSIIPSGPQVTFIKDDVESKNYMKDMRDDMRRLLTLIGRGGGTVNRVGKPLPANIG